MSRAGRWARNGALLAGGAFLVFLAVFALDMWRHEGRVARNVMLEGVAVGGMPLDELDGLIASTATAYAEAPVSIQMAEGQIDHEANQVASQLTKMQPGSSFAQRDASTGFLAISGIGPADFSTPAMSNQSLPMTTVWLTSPLRMTALHSIWHPVSRRSVSTGTICNSTRASLVAN